MRIGQNNIFFSVKLAKHVHVCRGGGGGVCIDVCNIVLILYSTEN